eukprot:Sro279_g106731.2  (349) ;mRNA; f:22018-23064
MMSIFNILLCVHAAILLASVNATGTSEPQKYALTIIDLNAEHRRLVPISGYVILGGNLVGGLFRGFFGESVAIDETGTTIIVREFGTDTIRVYENAANGWTQKGQDLTGFPIRFVPAGGLTVAISGDGSIVVVSSSVYEIVEVFQYDTSTMMWLQRGSTIQGFELDGSAIYSFGSAISLSADGNKIQVGAHLHSSPMVDLNGFATTYFWNSTDWELETYFSPDFNTVVSGLYGETDFADLGKSVSVSGDGNWIAVGMPGSGISDNDSTRFGECRVYRSDGSIQQVVRGGGAMFGSTIQQNFGFSVALNYDGSIIAVGSPGYDVLDVATQVGKVQVFRRTGATWGQLGR